MSLLGEVVESLEKNRIRFAVIGAAAMAVHGVSRSTFDIDLLTTDEAVLDPEVWSGLGPHVRVGEQDDPLAGMVRFRAAAEPSVDLIVGRPGWQARAIERAQHALVASVDVPVATVADLILLKLYAGGIQDRWDIEQLLASSRDELVLPTIASEIHELPSESRALWKSLVEVDPRSHS